ncbi:MAG: hypothetical protein ACI8RZ_005522 [Myxococcota bacterium]|jgi:hypothetical protein
MLSWLISIAVVLGGFVLAAWGMKLFRQRNRAAAARIPKQTPSREAVDVAVRLTCDAIAPGGLRPGRDYRGLGHMVLVGERLVLATDQGRVLEVSRSLPGQVRAPGPRMLIVEGSHPSGRARVRVELVVDEEQAWAADIEGLM